MRWELTEKGKADVEDRKRMPAVPSPIGLARSSGIITPPSPSTLVSAVRARIPIGFSRSVGGGSDVWSTVRGSIFASRKAGSDELTLTLYLDGDELMHLLDAEHSGVHGSWVAVRCGLTVRPPAGT